jgi:hypothetical protein
VSDELLEKLVEGLLVLGIVQTTVVLYRLITQAEEILLDALYQ